jgi:hypothetical protein
MVNKLSVCLHRVSPLLIQRVRMRTACSALDTVQRAVRLYGHARAIVADGAAPMASEWHMSETQIRLVRDAFGSVVDGVVADAARLPLSVPTSSPRPVTQPFDQGTQLFLAAVAQGMPFEQALMAFGHLGCGYFSHDDQSFFQENPMLGPTVDRIRSLHSTTRLVIHGAEGEEDTTLFLVDSTIAAISSTRRLRAGWLEDC